MYNDDILNRLKGQFGLEETIKFCEMTSAMYYIKYTSCKNNNCREEYDYEMQWWDEAGKDLIEKRDGTPVQSV